MAGDMTGAWAGGYCCGGGPALGSWAPVHNHDGAVFGGSARSGCVEDWLVPVEIERLV